jgi:hypothetical protein
MRMSYIRKAALAVMAADNPTGNAEAACYFWNTFAAGYQWIKKVKKIKRLIRRVIK